MNAKLAELELRHAIDALERFWLLVKDNAIEPDAERLLDMANDTLALLKKENQK
jgi:hypothetical protein